MTAQERINQLAPRVAEAMADPENADALARHPLPWDYFVTYHDGPCIQFKDANGAPCLPGFIYDEDVAAVLLHAINRN